jgi:hypothetical protein
MAGGIASRPTNAAATTALPAPCSPSRQPTGSPRKSSASPIRPKAATATANTVAAAPPMSTAATSSPAATGAPPPRGVGVVWDDRGPGMSIAARRSSGMVTGSATTTTVPHVTAAKTVMRSPGTE